MTLKGVVKSKEELFLMTRKSDGKFGEKLTPSFKNDMNYSVNFNASCGKCGNMHFGVQFLSIAYKF